MNTIIIHPFNRVKSTPMHEMSATLIAPVSKWYRKPTPWWIDSFEEVCLQSIVETDEVAEEEEDVIDEQEDEEAVDEEDGAEGVTLGAFVDAELACNKFTFEDFQGNDEGKQNSLNETDIFQNITLEDNDLPKIDRDPRDDEIKFLGVVMLVDSEASFDSDGECEGDDTLTDVTFIGEDATIVLEAELVDEHEWDEKAMLNIIVVEVDSRKRRRRSHNEWVDNSICPGCGANRITRAESPRNTGGVGDRPGKPAFDARWVTTRSAHQLVDRVTEADMTLARRI